MFTINLYTIGVNLSIYIIKQQDDRCILKLIDKSGTNISLDLTQRNDAEVITRQGAF